MASVRDCYALDVLTIGHEADHRNESFGSDFRVSARVLITAAAGTGPRRRFGQNMTLDRIHYVRRVSKASDNGFISSLASSA